MEGTKAAIGLTSPISQVQWVAVNSVSDYFSESSFENSVGTSSSSIDMVDDDASSSIASFGPLYELSELMAQLPIKRGLSKYYEGKSQSFGRLGSVMTLADLAKEGNYSSHNKRMKLCKSLDGRIYRSSFSPKPTIKKKSYSTRPILSPPSDTNADLVGACTVPNSLQKKILVSKNSYSFRKLSNR